MELGIDSFAAVRTKDGRTSSPDERAQAIEELLSRIEVADEIGLDTFGIGEHHRPEYLDSASHILLAAAAARTKRIELISAVTVLSAADPVRVFQQLSTVDLISRGRAGVVLGRGSFSEAFPLFGYSFQRLRSPFRREIGSVLETARGRTCDLGRQVQTRIEWPGRLSQTVSRQTPDVDRSWWHAGLFRPCRTAWHSIDGRDYRRRNPSFPSAGGPVLSGRS